MSSQYIKASDIKKIYKMGKEEVAALRGVSLEINEGEYIAITGPSGSGKSTLLHIVGCLDVPSDGKYNFKGKETSKLSDKELSRLRNKDIGFVFQFFYLLPRENVLHNVELPLFYRNITQKEREDMAISALEKVDMEHRIKHIPSELSGGERQRVAIARALVGEPDLILADEPTGNLDTKTGAEIVSLFEKLNEEGKTVIIITHEYSIAERADRVLTLIDGKIEGE
jgi:putative ABC transport system ATP-binding protein